MNSSQTTEEEILHVKVMKTMTVFFLSSTRMQNIVKTAVKIYIFNGMMKEIRKSYYEDIIIFEST